MIYDSILCSPSGNEHVYLVLKYLDQLEEYLSTLEFNQFTRTNPRKKTDGHDRQGIQIVC